MSKLNSHTRQSERIATNGETNLNGQSITERSDQSLEPKNLVDKNLTRKVSLKKSKSIKEDLLNQGANQFQPRWRETRHQRTTQIG